jgi:hypothetical protein
LIRKISAALLVTTFLLCGCKSNKNETSSRSVPEIKKDIKPVEFIPPADSLISVKQIKAWISSNPLLDSLTLMYSDSFKTQDASLRMHYQEVFSAAQNKICVLAGLQGGYKEYKWILSTIGNPINKPSLDSVKAGVY